MSTSTNYTSQHTFTTTAKLKPCNILKAFFFPVKYMWLLQFLVCLFLENSVGHKNLYFSDLECSHHPRRYQIFCVCMWVCVYMSKKEKNGEGWQEPGGFCYLATILLEDSIQMICFYSQNIVFMWLQLFAKLKRKKYLIFCAWNYVTSVTNYFIN